MKYFTKEWYELNQNTNAYLPLEEAKEAESFSEEYFQQLYDQQLTKTLTKWEEFASYQVECKALNENYIITELFDREKISKQFHEAFIYNQEHIREILPVEILEKIADIRVYVLKKASHEVLNAVTQFCKESEKLVRNTAKEYQEYYKKALESFDRNIVENINFHDCRIIDLKHKEQSLSILFDNSGGFTDIDEIHFENYKIIKQAPLILGSWWLYEEIYKINDKYELHVLLHNKEMDLVEFIICADHISFNRNQKKSV